jgi:hypothetical protein
MPVAAIFRQSMVTPDFKAIPIKDDRVLSGEAAALACNTRAFAPAGALTFCSG